MASDQGVPQEASQGTGTDGVTGGEAGAEGISGSAGAAGGGGWQQHAVRGEQDPVREDMSWLRRPAPLLIAGLAGLSYAWALNRDPLEPYYAAAVRSMSMNWHNFIYGAFDPAGTITLDKLQGAFWLQALAVRAFGFHPWVIVAPQAAEGVLTVLVLYRAVQRLAGPAAGLTAAFVVAVSPATVALNRGTSPTR